MLAAREGHLEIVRMLLAAGADANAKSEWEETALGLAKKRENSDKYASIIELLKQYGARE
jgi:ankyrin repeat protein